MTKRPGASTSTHSGEPTDHFTLFANLAFIDATYKDKMTLGTDPVDLSGEPTGEPYLSAALGARYGWTLGAAGELESVRPVRVSRRVALQRGLGAAG